MSPRELGRTRGALCMCVNHSHTQASLGHTYQSNGRIDTQVSWTGGHTHPRDTTTAPLRMLDSLQGQTVHTVEDNDQAPLPRKRERKTIPLPWRVAQSYNTCGQSHPPRSFQETSRNGVWVSLQLPGKAIRVDCHHKDRKIQARRIPDDKQS